MAAAETSVTSPSPPRGHVQGVTPPPRPIRPTLPEFDPSVVVDLDVRDELRAGREPLARILASTGAGTGTAAAPALQSVVAALRSRGMVIFISDLLLDRALVLKALKFLRHRGHQVLVLHIADPAELELTRGDETRFRDPETQQVVTLAPSEWSTAYRETVQGVVRAWGEASRAAGIRYSLISTDTPFGTALGQALGR